MAQSKKLKLFKGFLSLSLSPTPHQICNTPSRKHWGLWSHWNPEPRNAYTVHEGGLHQDRLPSGHVLCVIILVSVTFATMRYDSTGPFCFMGWLSLVTYLWMFPNHYWPSQSPYIQYQHVDHLCKGMARSIAAWFPWSRNEDTGLTESVWLFCYLWLIWQCLWLPISQQKYTKTLLSPLP